MTRVIKIGGRPQADPELAALIAEVATQSPEGGAASLVLVHGGGDEVSTLQKLLGGSTQFVNGRRVTTAQDIEIVRMALSGSANKRLVSSLVCRGVKAIGISGEDASLILASPLDPDRLGHVGEPQRINVALIWHLLDGGYLPVVSPVSRNASVDLGRALNVNGDDAASAIAVALAAEELLLVADVPGVLVDGGPVAKLDARNARALIANGTAKAGMAAKLEAAIAALDGGVERVRIADLRGITDLQRGTTLVPDGGRS